MRFFDTKIAKRLDDSPEVSGSNIESPTHTLGLLLRLPLVVRLARFR